jgi:hypothetical protein
MPVGGEQQNDRLSPSRSQSAIPQKRSLANDHHFFKYSPE